MKSEQQIKERITVLRGLLNRAYQPDAPNYREVHILEGNIGALEWVLHEDPPSNTQLSGHPRLMQEGK